MVILNTRRRQIQVAQLISSKHFSIKVFRYSYSLALRNAWKNQNQERPNKPRTE